MKGVTALAFASFVSFTAATGEAVAQTTKSLAGAYILVSVGDLYGKNPAGILIFDGNGNYSLTITRSDLPKFVSNSRLKGTGDENKAVVTGSITHFGRYSVKDKTLTFDDAAANALLGSRLLPLPRDFGPPRVTMQVTFFYNQGPQG